MHFDSRLEFGSTSLKELEMTSRVFIKELQVVKKKSLLDSPPMQKLPQRLP
jgi:hypothetical protein